MGKKIYDAVMLIIAICMLIIGQRTYEATVAEPTQIYIEHESDIDQ